jgi:hypothetical protein
MQPNHPNRKYTPEQIEQVRQLYLAGHSCTQIGQMVDFLGQGTPKQLANRVWSITHYNHFPMRDRGAPLSMNGQWKGGWTIDKSGYILVKAPIGHPGRNHNGYIREHRLVMEQKLGRYLDSLEVVHHIDENPANNHPDNLELFDTNGKHLAETLQGKCPQWTADGKSRILAATLDRWSKHDAAKYKPTPVHSTIANDTNQPSP